MSAAHFLYIYSLEDNGVYPKLSCPAGFEPGSGDGGRSVQFYLTTGLLTVWEIRYTYHHTKKSDKHDLIISIKLADQYIRSRSSVVLTQKTRAPKSTDKIDPAKTLVIKLIDVETAICSVAMSWLYLSFAMYSTTNLDLSAADCPNDTSEGDGSNGGNNSSHNSSNAADVKPRRDQIKSRGALFNGSRNGSLSSGREDEDDDKENNNRNGPQLPHQCESSALEESETETSSPKHAENAIPAIPVNSTQLDHSRLENPMFEMSVLQGISRISYSIWESAKSVSLFGRGRNLSAMSDISISSELCGLSDISEISLNITIQNTAVLEESLLENKTKNSEDEPEDERNKIYTGLANPEITPIPLRLKGYKQSKSRVRTRSERSPLVRTGPYEIPPDIVLRKKQRANMKTRATHLNETPTIKRRRNWSESFCSKYSPGKLDDIGCVRVRDSGLYDSSNGLGSYFHLELNYLEKQDTGKIDKESLLLEIRKALSIPRNESHESEADNSVSLVWNEEEIEAVSRTHIY